MWAYAACRILQTINNYTNNHNNSTKTKYQVITVTTYIVPIKLLNYSADACFVFYSLYASVHLWIRFCTPFLTIAQFILMEPELPHTHTQTESEKRPKRSLLLEQSTHKRNIYITHQPLIQWIRFRFFYNLLFSHMLFYVWLWLWFKTENQMNFLDTLSF